MFRKIAIVKNYFGRVSGYLSPINFILLLLTFKQNYNIEIKAIYVILITIPLIILFGFIDHKFILKHELNHINERNNIKIQLDRIEKRLKNGS